MKIIDVVPRQIVAVLELSSEEIRGILDFFEKCMPLYAKVHLDGPISESEQVTEGFINLLKSISKTIEKETER